MGKKGAKTGTELRRLGVGIGDLVLAKVKGFPAWPAKVSRPENWKRASDPKKYFVQFFGTQEIAFVAPSDVQAFTSELKSKLVARCKGKTVKYFAQAVKEICEAFEELDKSNWNCGDDVTSPGHNASNVEESNANGSCTEFSRRPKYEELCGSESELDLVSGLKCCSSMDGLLQRGDFKTFSDRNGMLEKVKENIAGRDMRTEASIRSLDISSSVKEETSVVEIKADADAHRERIESSRASSSSPYSIHSKVKHVTSHHGDSKKVNAMLLGASANLKSSSVGNKGSANGHRSVGSIAGSKREIDGLIRSTDDTNSGVLTKDQIPQKLSARDHVKQLSAGVNRLESSPRWKIVQCLPQIPKLSGVRKSTTQDSVAGSKKCGEREYSSRKDRQPDLQQLQSVKQAKLEHSASDVVKGSIVSSDKGYVELKRYAKEAFPSVEKCQRQGHDVFSDVNISADKRSFGLRTLKSDIPKRRRAVCLYNDDDEDAPKTPVHGGSMSTSKIRSSATIPDSLKNNENHDPFSWGESIKVSITDATGSQNEGQLNVNDSTKAQESHRGKKEEFKKKPVKEANMGLVSPAKSPLVAAAAKRLVDKQKPNRLPLAKEAILHSYSKAQNVPGKDLKFLSIGSNSAQNSTAPVLGERAKGTSKTSSRLNGPASSLNNQMDHDSALGDGRLEDAKDRFDSLVDSKALDSAMSMKHLIAAAQAKRWQALSQTASQGQGNGNSGSAPTTDIHGKSPTPVNMPHDFSHGMGNVIEHDAQELNLRGSSSPHIHIRHLDLEEPEDKGPGSGHQGAGSALSGGTEAVVARDAFEGMIETLSRTKESIGRATRLAIDCAKYGIANEIVELLIRKLENEAIIHRRVDLFFLVDSITQCSHSQKGVAGASYIPIIQEALPRLLGPAAPFGTSARENRRQCLKILRLWLERRIFPESVLRRFMDDIGSSHDDSSSGISFRRPSRAERSVDDPIREMEGMLVDEYGSNATFNLAGFLSTHGFVVDDDDGDEEDVPGISSKETDTSPLQCSNNSGGLETGINTPNDRHHHILEEVDGELEMEDVSGHLKDGTLSPSGISKNDTPEMLWDAQLESSINDISKSPLMEGSPPLPPESPPPFPPLPTSPPPPPPPSSPSPPPPPPPPPVRPSQFLPSTLVSSALPKAGNHQPLLPPQPSISPQVFLCPPSMFPSMQAPPVDYSVSTVTNPVQIACNTPQVPSGPSASLDTPVYRLAYGGPQAGQSNQQFQQSQQYQSCQATFTAKTFSPVTLPQPPSGHFSYNNPTVQSQMSQPRPHPPPLAALPHPYSSGSHSEGMRRVGDEQWRSAFAEYKVDNQHNGWMNGGKMPSCPPENCIGEAYFRPSDITQPVNMGYQVSAPNPSTAGHAVNQMFPPRPDMSSHNHWRPV